MLNLVVSLGQSNEFGNGANTFSFGNTVYLVFSGGNSHFHKHRAKPNPAILSPSVLLSVLMRSSENPSFLSLSFFSSSLQFFTQFIFSSCGRKSVFAIVTRFVST